MPQGEEIQANRFQIVPFKIGNSTRHLFRNKQTLVPSTAMSIYEAHLAQKTRSHNTANKELQYMSYLYTWAIQNQLDIEAICLSGNNLSPVQIRTFAHWLKSQKMFSGKHLSLTTCNSIFTCCAQVLSHFMDQYGHFNNEQGETGTQAAIRSAATASLRQSWNSQKTKDKKKPMADDLKEEEIKTINDYLKPMSSKLFNADPIEIRNYLAWRLLIEFGLRVGELLALRLEDCPSRGQNFIRIVRIEERDDDYYDPRLNSPRPKTLSRELGFLLEDSPIKRLISEYISRCRIRKIVRFGKKSTEHVMEEHPFLITATGTGKPLSISSMELLAAKIRKDTGVTNFYWHLCRHAFFNRAWAAIADNSKYKDRKMDLVYWGGWENEKSLKLYINRAQSERAKQVMQIWNSGSNTWDSLK